jgi:hypothetical protein
VLAATTTTPGAASPYAKSWADTPRTETWHRVPPDGVQGYAQPSTEGALGEFVPPGAQVGLVKTQGDWAEVVIGGTTAWVDGRLLMPPPKTVAPAGVRTAPSRPTSTIRTASSTSAWAVLSAIAGVGVLVGAIFEWLASSLNFNSFDVPVQFLFGTYTLQDREPRVGYFLVAFGVVAILTSFREDAVWVRRIAGMLALATAALFCYQVQDAISGAYSVGFANRSLQFFDVIGSGPFITGISGLVLAVLPRPRR